MKHLNKFNEEFEVKGGPVLNYIDTDYGQIFWDQNNKIITGIHENDGRVREEYMADLFKHFGIKVVCHENEEVPDFVKEWPGYSNYA